MMRQSYWCIGWMLLAAGCPAAPGDEETATGTTGGGATETTAATTAEPTGSGTTLAPTTADPTTGGPECGDGSVDPGETCDDGNTVDGDGCNKDCEPSARLLWERLSGSIGPDMYHDMVLGPDQTLLIGGAARTGRANIDRWLVRYDLTGEKPWERRYDAGVDVEAVLAVARRDAAIYAAGSKLGDDEQDLWIARLDLAGTIVWEDELSSGFGHDYATGLALTPEGDVVVTGIVGAAGGANVWTRRYGADGAVQWTQVAADIDHPTYYLGPDVAVEGERILVGFADEPNDFTELLLAYPIVGGEALWQQASPAAALIYGVAALGEDVVTTGQGFPKQAMFVRRVADGGAMAWDSAACIGTAGRAIEVDGQGDVVVVGYGPGKVGINARLCKFTPDGQLRWGKDLDGEVGDDLGMALAITPDGRIAVAGSRAVAADDNDGWLALFAP